MRQNVVVVGAGPVGLTMAAELARYGVSVRIVDKAAERTDKSKALVLWSRSLELIDRMGCGLSFVTAGLKVTAANIFARGSQVAHISLDTLATPHPYALMLPQSETERLMEQHLNGCGVQVERQVELVRFVPDEDRVSAVMRHADGQEETLDAAWLIGCDGAHSSVRHGLGMQFEGDTLPSDWILADVRLDGLGNPPSVDTYWHSDGVLALFPISPGRYRIIADIGETKPGVHRSDPTLEEVQTLLDRRGPGGIQATAPVWLAGFQINERKVADYRAGRAFLVGDAAHIHSPAGGQGMNTGMQDACNLAWKLALVCRGLAASKPLLDSYSIERSEVGRQVLANAGRLTALATMRGGLRQGLRNHVASLVFGLSPVRQAMTNTVAELSIGYPKSPLTQADGSRHFNPGAGARYPAAGTGRPVGSGDTPRFALFAHSDTASATFIARHRDLLESEPRPPASEDGVWLVRPDGYVAITAARGTWDKINTYMDRIAGGIEPNTAPAPAATV
jgi:2-polyprenyl-6-methoxyphenol hydroxylase-like FAD-dependent oxidoreductase